MKYYQEHIKKQGRAKWDCGGKIDYKITREKTVCRYITK